MLVTCEAPGSNKILLDSNMWRLTSNYEPQWSWRTKLGKARLSTNKILTSLYWLDKPRDQGNSLRGGVTQRPLFYILSHCQQDFKEFSKSSGLHPEELKVLGCFLILSFRGKEIVTQLSCRIMKDIQYLEFLDQAPSFWI